MGRLSRGVARLVPAERRDWLEAIWAESSTIPPGSERLAWRLGAARVVVREAVLRRRTASAVAFSVAAVFVVVGAWAGDPTSGVTWVGRFDVIATVVVLAALPLLAHRSFGRPGTRWLSWLVRVAAYIGILALMLGKARVEHFGSVVPSAGPSRSVYRAIEGAGGHQSIAGDAFVVFAEFVFFCLAVGTVAMVFWATAEHSRITADTVMMATVAGATLGVVTYLVIPLGFGDNPSGQRRALPGSAINLLVAIDWALILGAPLAAALLAGRRYRRPGNEEADVPRARIRQAIVGGMLTSLVGALTATTLGTCTIALMLRVDSLRDWLFPGPRSATGAYANELAAASNSIGYWAVCIVVPMLGLAVGTLTAGLAWGPRIANTGKGRGPRGGGPRRPAPMPGSPSGGQTAEETKTERSDCGDAWCTSQRAAGPAIR